MAVIDFFEKPGCVNNTKQKQRLSQSGHQIVALDIRAQNWTPETLRPFFGNRPVALWFNRAAPAVKAGTVIPETTDEATALALMCKDPLLIRRPLMHSDGGRMVGFDALEVDKWIGLSEGLAPLSEACPQPQKPCTPPRRPD